MFANGPNQFAVFQQSAVDSLVRVANVHLESTRRLADLNFATTREMVEESVKHAQTLAGVKDLREAVALQTAGAKPAANRTIAYSRSVYEIFNQANNELKEIGEAQVSELNKQVATTLDNVSKSAPAGSEPVVAFVKSTVSAAANALDQAVKVTKQLNAAAEANFAAAFAAVEKPLA